MKTTKNKIHLLLSACLTCCASFSQTIVRIDPAQNGAPSPDQYKPGLFAQPRNAAGDVVFSAINTKYNCLRTLNVAWLLLSSLNEGDFFTRLKQFDNEKDFHTDMAQRTDKLIIQLNGMPQWLSSSTDSTILPDGGWHVYNTAPPASYTAWGLFIRKVVDTIQSWGISPYYELWNEPDLAGIEYWKGTSAELLELYKHTAIAVKQADPNSKVGGFGLNQWQGGKGQALPPANFGYIPDSVANQSSLLGKLIDSAAVWGSSVPVDFISWHLYSMHSSELKRASQYFQAKIAGHGMSPVEMFITEWNTSYLDRETAFHSAQVLRFHQRAAEANMTGTAICFQDFTHGPTEFFGEWGLISEGGLIKPAYNAILLLDYLQKGADTISVAESSPIVSFASIKSDTVKILLSNYAYWPFYITLEELLYNHPFNQVDLFNAGYTIPPVPGGDLDSAFYGLLPPQGPPALINAINAAKVVYTQHTANLTSQRNISLRLKNQTGLKNGRMFVVDSTHNNIMYLYDSLLAAGYTRTQAIAVLYPAQTITFSSIQITDSVFNFSMQANATVLLEFYGVSTASGISTAAESNNGIQVYPNPFHSIVSFRLPTNEPCEKLVIRDLLGNTLLEKENLHANFSIDGSMLAKGVYFYEITSQGKYIIGKVVKQ